MFYVGLEVHTTQITVCGLNNEGNVATAMPKNSSGCCLLTSFPKCMCRLPMPGRGAS